jgi:hypothetical protein
VRHLRVHYALKTPKNCEVDFRHHFCDGDRKAYWLRGARRRAWYRSGTNTVSVCMCYTKQKRSGYKRIVMAAVPTDGNHDTPEPEVYSWPPTPSSMEVRRTCSWTCRGGSVSSSIANARLAADSSSRKGERTGARAGSPAIGEHRRFRNAGGRGYGGKAADGDAYSGGRPNSSRPKDR